MISRADLVERAREWSLREDVVEQPWWTEKMTGCGAPPGMWRCCRIDVLGVSATPEGIADGGGVAG
jgi:hypothetical protein